MINEQNDFLLCDKIQLTTTTTSTTTNRKEQFILHAIYNF